MKKDELEGQRNRILSKFKDLVELANEIEEEMLKVSHPRGVAYRSLKPKSGMYIVHTDSGFTAHCQHSDGTWYDIQIHKYPE